MDKDAVSNAHAAIALEAISSLCDSWDEYAAPRTGGFEFRIAGPTRRDSAIVTFGLAAHCHALARVVETCADTAPPAVLAPLVRSMVEMAVTANWVLKNPEGAVAVLDRAAHDREMVASEAATSRSRILRDGAGEIPQYPHRRAKTASQNAARNFKAMCADLDGAGDELYLAYRALSWNCHAGITVVDVYFDTTTAPPGFGYRAVQENPATRSLMLMQAARAVLWAGGAVNAMDNQGKQRGPVLRRAAKVLGTVSVLELTMSAKRRSRQSVKARAAERSRESKERQGVN